ncbi:unnamed protein product [Didymodactylos carnosus]|uniref:ADP ribosyltransferase domain-containing protein n=1 Tax=Didymodactylos carnosus TaxID=1234261 RepID=A0A8S2P054_9BILA|nr:unnamed protein product [Didymodactylos carnosus]CAF4027735.1 unnamed protein product [Didymodactylos carnosus]
MVDQLKSCGTTQDEICACAVRLYSAESFLYKLVNNTLRNDDMSKVDTLGPFCCLLRNHLVSYTDAEALTVYRGVFLTDEMIKEYKEAIDQHIKLLSFTSTSRDRCIAEKFGNTLFIIKLKAGRGRYEKDISSLSQYPHEQEVLLTAGERTILVEKVEFDSTSEKHLIYMLA